MKLIKSIPLVSLIVFVLFQSHFSRSDRTLPEPAAVSSPLNTSESANDDSACENEVDEIVYIPPTKIDLFVKELNKLGTCGYRLEKAAKIPLGTESAVTDLYVFGILKLDAGNKYEYNWFAAKSAGEVVTLANFQAENGFYFRKKMMFVSGRCSEAGEKQRKDNDTAGGLGDLANLGLGASGSVFIFERKNGVVKKNEYRVLGGATARGEKALAKNQAIMDEYVSGGFRPVEIFYLGMFDLFAVVMEKDAEAKPEGEYRLLRQSYFMNKKLAAAGREGFKPILLGFYFAILHRNTDQPFAVRYESADSYSKITKNLPKWTRQGARYQVTGVANYDVGCDPHEGKLFFSMPETDGNAKMSETDYRIFRISNFEERFIKKKVKDASFSDSPTPEMMRELRGLLNQGYAVREVFFQDEVFILLERSKI